MPKDKNIEVQQSKKLSEDGNKISFREAYCVLMAVGIGVGSMQMNNFYMIYPQFYWYPLITSLANSFFGAVSIHLLVDVKSHQRKLGSLQEFAYYYTGERSFIMIIGSLYGLFCCISSAYCLNHIAQFMADIIDAACLGLQWYIKLGPALQSEVKMVFYYGVLAILSVVYYHLCKI